MGKPQNIQITIRLILLIINGVIIVFSFKKGFIVNTIGLSLLLLFQFFLFTEYLKKLFTDIEKSIDCLLFDDFSSTISAKKRKNPLHNKTALLLEKHRKQSLSKTSEQLIFTNIIESLGIGILILRKNANGEISVFQINKAFTNFLKIPKFYNWNLLQTKIGKLSTFIKDWKEIRNTISLKINDNKENFFLKTAVTQTHEFEYLVVSLETIQQLIDKKEKEAWYKLMNVMSHEIINTITPIRSLAENLHSLIQEENTDEDTIDELSQGLSIIKRRSLHLTSFVDTYRKLTELPLPNKKEISLTETIKNTLDLYKQDFLAKKINLIFNIKENYILKADKNQIEQILINIISNCLYALAETNDPEIKIQLSKENNRLHLEISDNGIGISKEIKENIFVPYFTTRKNGSGIGLTLTKSIVEAHKGSIHFNTKNGKTTFIITFIL
ncbi:HAMP domain-containing histidine kinase [Polaribacter batillariae]|uniref:histidine kinase n=1 Tax=Polaribacter batillariae TaxID=2808900 RepID=A0ABX7SY76_9FLAO|nr:HAMP domain-containing sensor histidine kinase [Polaribacter batillariae]QTD37754.1 HAMP domain-containing histidine kinase [Polaribacter batillariae]